MEDTQTLVTEKGKRLKQAGLDVRNFSFCHDRIQLGGNTLVLLTKRGDREFTDFPDFARGHFPQYFSGRGLKLNTNLGAILASEGYDVRPESSHQDYVTHVGGDIGYITRTKGHEFMTKIKDMVFMPVGDFLISTMETELD